VQVVALAGALSHISERMEDGRVMLETLGIFRGEFSSTLGRY